MTTTAKACAFPKAWRLLAVIASTLLAVTSASAQNVSDATAPTITEIAFAPTTVDTTNGAQNITVTVTATDDLSGVNYLYVYLRTTATSQPNNSSSTSCYVGSLSSGSRTSGTFTGTCTFQQYSRSGDWFAYQAYAQDNVGNYQYVSNSNNTQLAIAPQVVTVTAPNQPTQPPTATIAPEIVSVTVSPTSVNTIGAAATLTVEAHVIAATASSPFYYGYAYLFDPTYGQSLPIYFYSWNRVSGDAADGVYRGTASLPEYSLSGEWVWYQAVVNNQAGHYNYYYGPQNGRFRYRVTYNGVTWTTADLATSGPSYSPETLSVESVADTTPPTLVNFELTPSSIDVSTSPKTVTMTIAATDDLSGVNYGCAFFVSPNGQQNRGGCVSSPTTTTSIFFPQFSQAGNWALSYMYLVDRRGNVRYLYSNDLQALGFSAGLQISSGVEVQNATGFVDSSVTLTAKLTKLGAPAPGKTLSFTLGGSPVGSAITDSSGIATLSNVSIAGIPIGTHVNAIVAAFAGDAEQAAASGQATLIVTNKQNQTISFAVLADRSLSASPFVVTATASSGLTVTFGAIGSCTVSGDSVTLTGAGSCTIVASQAGNAGFNPAPSVSRSFNVLQKSDQTITFAAIATKRYGDASFTVAPTTSSGLTVTLAAAGACSANGFTITVNTAGSCTVTASQAGTADYNAAPNVVRSFAIDPASLTVTADASPATVQADSFTKIYNGHPFTGFTVRFDGFANGDGVGALGGALTFSGAGVTATSAGGPYGVTPGGLTATNYTINFVSGTVTISQVPLTVTANDATKLLNAPLPSFGASFSGFVNGETNAVLAGTLSCTSTATPSSPVGTYPISCSGVTSANYAIQFGPGTLSIQYAGAGTTCQGESGHAILEPVNADGSSVFKQGSSVPAKFRVCDADGVSIGDPNVVRSFTLVQTIAGTVSNVVSEEVASTTPTSAFRWDATAQQWIFNISTKPLAARQTYIYNIVLNDGTSLQFRFGLR